MRNLGRLAVKVKTLELSDSLGKAAEAVRASTVGAAPVVQYGRVIALVSSEILAEYLTRDTEASTSDACVAQLPLQGVVALPQSLSPSEALSFFRANELECAPVVDAVGQYVGMVSNAELVSAVCGRVRPPIVGGMATPFGVYLAGGGVRGGVGDLALMSTGVYLTVIQIAAVLLAHAATEWILSPGRLASLPLLGGWIAAQDSSLVAGGVEGVLFALVFAVFFRLSWITGFHAAEHQVVHTIEAGDELVPDVVRTKPRVHPRCGTNLVVAVSLMTLFWEAAAHPPKNPHLYDTFAIVVNPLTAMVFTWIYWRRIGAWVQQNVTTRPANLGQLQSGILAAEQLMERYQAGPPALQRPFQRVWNMGLLQVVSGSCIVLGLLQVVSWIAPKLLPADLRAF